MDKTACVGAGRLARSVIEDLHGLGSILNICSGALLNISPNLTLMLKGKGVNQ
jgi:hypothetical protein